MKYFPAFLALDGRCVTIIGGGEEAARKARLLAAADAVLRVIAPKIDRDAFCDIAAPIAFEERMPQPGDFTAGAPAIIAIGDASPAVAAMAKDAGALVNVVDQPDLCDFVTPSIIDRGEVVIAISTSGSAPVLGQQLRRNIEQMAPVALGELAAFARSFRDTVKKTVPAAERRAFWAHVFNGPIAQHFLAGETARAHEEMIAYLNRLDQEHQPVGVVHLVGAGPGDPELLTLRAHRLLQEADVLVYDRLVSQDILNFARRDAERLYVGKAKSNHALPQEEIAQLLIAKAKQGKVVVRLKGGDPFVFGRGGEEAEALRAADVPVYVTPGITAATGCAAAAGFPLTHRDHAHAVTFVTAHAKADGDVDLDWASLAALGQTLVVYMGVSKAALIAERLIAHGLEASTPVAVVENGTLSNQRTIRAQLKELQGGIERYGVQGPALLVIGDVALLAHEAIARHIDEERMMA